VMVLSEVALDHLCSLQHRDISSMHSESSIPVSDHVKVSLVYLTPENMNLVRVQLTRIKLQ
jgi:hypothetical protein